MGRMSVNLILGGSWVIAVLQAAVLVMPYWNAKMSMGLGSAYFGLTHVRVTHKFWTHIGKHFAETHPGIVGSKWISVYSLRERFCGMSQLSGTTYLGNCSAWQMIHLAGYIMLILGALSICALVSGTAMLYYYFYHNPNRKIRQRAFIAYIVALSLWTIGVLVYASLAHDTSSLLGADNFLLPQTGVTLYWCFWGAAILLGFSCLVTALMKTMTKRKDVEGEDGIELVDEGDEHYEEEGVSYAEQGWTEGWVGWWGGDQQGAYQQVPVEQYGEGQYPTHGV
mmetsp:Transcript_45016/g.97783  ORF Transcript_45016/g.97783 Transcript_45016/m.97783 type:complete len:281 (-) Transcript_45016:68-910(-)|eukprot:CAMPEP_0204278188 /NCGR_PEP_ID=MMETSP0468-20130131/29721_1 /ASSEMBLY_ACC=CAM_ASM_000383 /TAXON_ID=2969 /ORGANISM="Oxyrrhis marina" /LENGTH=280 /DNA_ID=CAMNT_0051255063 /DNA_START=112 /DNA_END=954 /DNA_ORIENTATION=+